VLCNLLRLRASRRRPYSFDGTPNGETLTGFVARWQGGEGCQRNPRFFFASNSPQAIVDLTLAASNNGAKEAKLLYELLVGEMDVAVGRFNVTFSALLRETGHPPIRR
jgi:hypothetical protein